MGPFVSDEAPLGIARLEQSSRAPRASRGQRWLRLEVGLEVGLSAPSIACSHARATRSRTDHHGVLGGPSGLNDHVGAQPTRALGYATRPAHPASPAVDVPHSYLQSRCRQASSGATKPCTGLIDCQISGAQVRTLPEHTTRTRAGASTTSLTQGFPSYCVRPVPETTAEGVTRAAQWLASSTMGTLLPGARARPSKRRSSAGYLAEGRNCNFRRVAGTRRRSSSDA